MADAHQPTAPSVSPATLARGLGGARAALLALALAVGTAALYEPTLDYPFVSYDDPEYVSENVRVAQGLTRDNVSWAFTTTTVSNWHPLTWLSYLLDAQLFGVDARAFHATNVVLHALNAAVLFWLLWTATGRAGPSLVVAALFAVHPLNIQSVAWIAERKNLLSTLFWLLAILSYTAWTRQPRPLTYAATLAGLALSLLAKPMAVTFPFALLLWDYWPLGRSSLGARRLWLEKIPMIAVVAVVALVTYRVQSAAGSVTDQTFALSDRLANAIWSYAAYLGLMARPRNLAAFYPLIPASLPLWRVAAAAIGVLVVTGALFRARERARPQLVGWLWYLGTLVPVIGLVQVGSQAMADRYAYVPLIGIFMAVAWTGASFAPNMSARRALAAVAVVLVATLSVRTRQEMRVWRSSEALFQRTIRVEPEAWVAHYNLGTEYATRGDYTRALPRFQDTIRLAPRFARGYNGLGNVYDAQGKTAEAIAQYQRALELNPTLVEAQNNLGVDFALQGKRDDALRLLRSAAIQDPEFAEAHVNLGMLLRTMGRLDEALGSADRGVTLAPRSPTALYQRALTRLAAGRADEARADLERLRALSPQLAVQLEADIATPVASTP